MKNQNHYSKLKINISLEPIDLLKTMPFVEGNIAKYLLRFKVKGTPQQDLEKALDYLELLKGSLTSTYYCDPYGSFNYLSSLFAEREDTGLLRKYFRYLHTPDSGNYQDLVDSIKEQIKVCNEVSNYLS